MKDIQIAGQHPFEGVWKRAGKDTWAFVRTSRFYVAELTSTAVGMVSSATLIDGAIPRLAVPVAALALLPILILVFAACRAPFVQRNEARKEILELRRLQEPKLTIGPAVVQVVQVEYGNPASIHDVFRVRIVNDSDAMVEACTASLVDIKPFVQWLDLREANRTIYGGNDFDGYPDIPFPMSLSWSAHDSSSRAPSIEIPPHGDSLLDVCFYDFENSNLVLAFPSNEMRTRYLLLETDVVFEIRIDSKDCLPIYCACKYRPNPPIIELIDQCVIEYVGPHSPGLDDYRCFKQTPRPPYWN